MVGHKPQVLSLPSSSPTPQHQNTTLRFHSPSVTNTSVRFVSLKAAVALSRCPKARLRLVSVESAKSQVVAGTKWSITLQAVAPAANTGHIRIKPPLTTYVTEVFEKPTAAVKQPAGVAHLAVQPVVKKPVVGDGQTSGVAQPAVGNGQPAGVAQLVGDGQTSGGAQPVGGGQTSAVKQPALADSLKLVSFAKKK
ncbi:unnamed protein product [Closterium sp. Naga37s-1]|nr:unnamed protein product [Closterium sp. Naga37s-1]CAI5522759.1 unnamed protein product [Closterium sp. Naga37s-1]